MLSLGILCCLTASAYAAAVTGSTPSKDLFDVDTATKVAFYDFDKTTTINSFGPVVRDFCNATAMSEGRLCGDTTGDMVAALAQVAYADVVATFGGADRINRLAEHWGRMKSASSSVDNIFILSTSWMPVPAAEWKAMIVGTLALISEFDGIFAADHVLTLDDPGPGISADKGAVAKAKLDELSLTAAQCINVDDSSGNIDSQAGTCTDDWDPQVCDDSEWSRERSCDTLQVYPRAGMSETDLNYMEARGIFPVVCDSSETPSTSETPSESEDGVVSTFAFTKMTFFTAFLFFVCFC